MAAAMEDSNDANLVFTYIKTLVVTYVCLTVALYIFIAIGILRVNGNNSLSTHQKTVLLITAHPDDECMFFGPTLSRLTSSSNSLNRVHLLCLTNGNFYGNGLTREKEIIKSGKILGITKDRITVVNDRFVDSSKDGRKFNQPAPPQSKLPDDPVADWPPDQVQKNIIDVVCRLKPEEVYTFDEYGVSGHKNHIAVHKAVREIFTNGTKLRGVKSVYFLQSVNILRKYLAIFDLPLVLLRESVIAVAAPGAVLQIEKAMLAHYTQLEWFRLLYIIFSRYMTINSFTRLDLKEDKLEETD